MTEISEIERNHNHKQIVSDNIKAMANTEKIKDILSSFPEDKRRQYVSSMKQQIVASGYISHCKDCAKEFDNTLTDWENGKFKE